MGEVKDLEKFINEVSKRLDRVKAGVLLRMNIFNPDFVYQPEKSTRILEEIEKILRKGIRETDIITRTRTNEFSIFIELSKEESASAVVERIYKLSTYPIEERKIFINIGVSIFPVDGKTFKELFEKAGEALNEAIKEGANVIKFYSHTFIKEVSEILQTEILIEKAIKEDLFTFFYQPIFNAKDLKIVTFETLIRIVEKDGKIHPAKDFIHILEKHPCMDRLEEKIIKEAIKCSQKWGIPIAINLSETGFITGSFFEKLIKHCRSGCKIIVEIVERILIKAPLNCIEILVKLKDTGIEVAVDDFGAGYSLLAYLRDLPFDILKIDKAFIKELPHNNKARNIVELIVKLSKNLGIKTCAEGVEKEEQLEFLRSIECDYVQGFLLSEAFPKEEIEKRFFVIKTFNFKNKN